MSDELGWTTNAVSRPTMLMQLREEIREGSTDILDSEILSQMRTFINNPKKKRPEAESGKKDDLIFARCYDEKTKVLTDEGWKHFKDVKKGDLIPSLNLETGMVEKVKNIETIISDYDGKMVYFRSRGIDLLVTPNHKMVAAISAGQNEYKKFSLVEAKELVGIHFRLKKDAVCGGEILDGWEIPSFRNKPNKILERDGEGKILRSEGHQYSKDSKKIPIKEFLQFLGFYIAEGSGNKNIISLAQMPYSKGWKPIKECLSKLGINYKEGKDRFEIKDTQFSSYIKNLIPGYCYGKRIWES